MSGKHKLSIAAAFVLTSALLGCSPSKWTVKWLPVDGSSVCRANSGRLNIHLINQAGENWCWVASVSEVLNWYSLPNASPCQLYDLVTGRMTCQAQSEAESKGLKYVPMGDDNESYPPEYAASMYSVIYGHTLVNVRTKPLDGPLSFSQIKEKICPADGSLGTPYVWAYVNEIDEDGNVWLHDVVVKGYLYRRPEAKALILQPSSTVTEQGIHSSSTVTGAPDFRIALVDVHDPNAPYEANLITYDWFYDVDDVWDEEVMISNISIYGKIPVLSRY
jgi:hypothetical protein